MNPLFFADWNRVQRVFRGVMWVVVAVLVLAVFFAVSSRAEQRHAHLDLRGSGQVSGVSR
jgi:hypothetical protein